MYTETNFKNTVKNIIKQSSVKGAEYLDNALTKLYNELQSSITVDGMTPEEVKSFGSPLNKFADEANVRNLTTVNVDLIIYNRNTKQLRIIESKHGNEKINPGHLEVLRVFHELGENSNKYNTDVSIVYADNPFNKGVIKFIRNNEAEDTFNEFETQGKLRMFLNMTDKRK